VVAALGGWNAGHDFVESYRNTVVLGKAGTEK
jgi:hypothetical protein